MQLLNQRLNAKAYFIQNLSHHFRYQTKMPRGIWDKGAFIIVLLGWLDIMLISNLNLT